MTDGPWFDLALRLIGDTSKQVREAAVVLLRAAGEDILMERAAAEYPEMNSTERLEVARAVAGNSGAKGMEVFRGWLATEKNRGVAIELRGLIGQEGIGCEVKRNPGRWG